MKSIFEVREHEKISVEQLGAKPKFWYERDDEMWLFKEENRNTGEDWAEVVVADIFSLFELPHARYELANYFGKDGSETRGVVTRKISGELIHGNTLMGAVDFRYPALAKYGLKTHTVEAVSHVVSQLESYGNLGASEVFSGYLMIDALVGNQDRHHQNWGAIEYNGRRYLAPSFDHGASCARNLSDNERDERLNTKDLGYSILTFSARARSAFYSEATLQRPLGTHRAFLEYCIVSGIEKTTWLTKLENIREVDLSKLLDSIPPVRMSDTTRKFTLQLLMANRARLLDL